MTRKRTHTNPPGLQWFKSSYSGSNNNDCVEVAAAADAVAVRVRDSKAAAGPWLALSARAWADFVGYAAGRR